MFLLSYSLYLSKTFLRLCLFEPHFPIFPEKKLLLQIFPQIRFSGNFNLDQHFQIIPEKPVSSQLCLFWKTSFSWKCWSLIVGLDLQDVHNIFMNNWWNFQESNDWFNTIYFHDMFTQRTVSVTTTCASVVTTRWSSVR